MINIGDFRTKIEILSRKEIRDDDGYPIYEYSNIFGKDIKVPCKWKNTHGSEVFKALAEGFEQTAKAIIRYTPLVDVSCIIRKGDEEYEIISVDNINDRCAFIELTVKRRVGGA